MNGFTLVDYSAFGLWIPISIGLSYLLVRKLNLLGGGNKNQKILALGFMVGNLLNLLWKKLWLFIVN